MDWNRLQVFFEVYRQESVEAAAKTLFISQSAVSQQIKKLEGEIGGQLFQRSARKLSPLPHAEELFRVIAEFSERVGQWESEVQKGRRIPAGALRLAAPPYFGKKILIPILFAFRKKYPGVVVDVKIINHAWIITEMVLNGELDLGIVDYSDTMEERYPVSVTPLMKEDLTIIGLRKIVPAGSFDYDLALTQTFVSYVPNALGVRMWFKYQWNKMPAKLKIAMSCEDVETVAEAVKNGLGLGLLPTHVVEKELKKGLLVAVDAPRGPRVNLIGMVQAPGRTPTLALKLLSEGLSAEVNIGD